MNTLIPANETERLVAVRSLLPSQDIAAPELDAIVELGRRIFQAPMAAVTIIDEDWQYIAASAGITPVDCARDKSICTRVVYSGATLTVGDLSAHSDFRDLPYVAGEPRFRFYAGIPLQLDAGVTVGAFCVFDIEPRQLSKADLCSLDKLGAVATALLRLQRSNIILKRDETSLKTAAMTDPLTGFFNRSALASVVDGMVAAAVGEGREVGAIYMDLDRFKAINDHHGHLVGDEVLAEAARRIRSVIRSGDMPVRLGGDEFALFFSGPCDIVQMEAIAQRLVDAFRRPFEINCVAVAARASIGVALAPRHATTRLELSRNADIALYEAKARGRDQYVVFKHSSER